MMTPKFIHLNAHSSFSLLEAMPSVKDYAKKAAEYNMPAVGVVDINSMFSAVDVTQQMPANGIQPIMGTLLGITPQGEVKNPLEADFVTLLVQNEKGWENILELSSKAFLNAPEHCDPQVTLEDLCTFNEGLILLTCNARVGALPRLLRTRQKNQAEKLLTQLKEAFKDRLYIEIQRHNLPEEQAVEPDLIEMAYAHNLPLVATNDCRFLEKKHAEAFDVMVCIGEGVTTDEPNRRRFNEEFYFKNQEEMATLFADLPEAIENTVQIAKRCAFKVKTGIYYMPAWKEDNGKQVDVNALLRAEAESGLEKRLEAFVFTKNMAEEEKQQKRKEYYDRLEFELKVIFDMGYSGYFLITSDFIRWAKNNDIPVGPGRGSGAGSLVAWAVDVTDLDPIAWGLYFERFLNPDRVSLPDFDIDFCQDRRSEVIKYVQQKYGEDSVSQIITFGTLKARACIRDVGRALQMSFFQVGEVAAFVPEVPNPPPIAQVLEEDERLKKRYDEEEDIKKLLDIAMELEGAYRHASTHAAGVHIADRPIKKIAPLYKDPKSGMPITQFAWYPSEEIGLVKFDFLGLKNLTVVNNAVKMVKQNKGEEIDILQIPLDDPKTLKMLQDGHTIGVFQVESRGMTEYVKKIAPDRFEFLSDVIALYRPGPMGSGMLDDFIECRHGRQQPNYPHPALKEVLEVTYGVPVYQEQVMRMAQVMAGYSLGQADMLRRAMGKKKPAEMAKHREIFVKGAKEIHNVEADKANEIFDLMANFAGYGFNKAHTVAYGLIAWQTAWLKANHPLEFMAASMTQDRGASDKVLKFMRELERMNVPLLPPDVNESDVIFKVEDQSIRYALTAIKGAGEESMKALVNEREKNGKFKTLFDLMERMPPKFMNKKQLEVLVQSGALDNIEPNRAKIMCNIDTLLAYNHQSYEEKNSNQIGLFGMGGESSALAKPVLQNAQMWDIFEKLEHEQTVFGFFLSDHPLSSYDKELKSNRDLTDIASLESLAESGMTSTKVACVLQAKREVRTKSGNRMAILTVSDPSGQNEIVLFPEAYEKYQPLVDKNVPLFGSVAMSADGERVRLNFESLMALDEMLDQKDKLQISLDNLQSLEKVKSIIAAQEQGDTECELCYNNNGKIVRLKLPEKVNFGKKAMIQLQSVQGVQIH